MGKKIVIKGADFYANSIETTQPEQWIENDFTWGKGGIVGPGQSSGNTNDSMSMIGLPLQYAEYQMDLKCANGYEIFAVAVSDNASGSGWFYREGLLLQEYSVPAGKYFEISVRTMNGSISDITMGHSSLLIKTGI